MELREIVGAMDDMQARIVRLETKVESIERDLKSLPVIQESMTSMQGNQTRLLHDVETLMQMVNALNNTALSGRTVVKTLLVLGGAAATIAAAIAWLVQHLPGWLR